MAEVKNIIAKYPAEYKQGATMPLLHLAQKQHGWLPLAAMNKVAKILDIPPMQVYEVATFYSMYLRSVFSSSLFISLHLSSSLFISLYLPSSPFISLHLPSSLSISLHLPSSLFISLHLPSSPLISPDLIFPQTKSWKERHRTLHHNTMYALRFQRCRSRHQGLPSHRHRRFESSFIHPLSIELMFWTI